MVTSLASCRCYVLLSHGCVIIQKLHTVRTYEFHSVQVPHNPKTWLHVFHLVSVYCLKDDGHKNDFCKSQTKIKNSNLIMMKLSTVSNIFLTTLVACSSPWSSSTSGGGGFVVSIVAAHAATLTSSGSTTNHRFEMEKNRSSSNSSTRLFRGSTTATKGSFRGNRSSSSNSNVATGTTRILKGGKSSGTSSPTITTTPSVTPTVSPSPTEEVLACTDTNVSKYYMCDYDHVAICYEHDTHLHNKCVPITNNDDILHKRPGIDYYKEKHLLVRCGCCSTNNDPSSEQISYPKNYDENPFCDIITPLPSMTPTISTLPTNYPTMTPTTSPTSNPTLQPTFKPTIPPTTSTAPTTTTPTAGPTSTPSTKQSNAPTISSPPTISLQPTSRPSISPTDVPRGEIFNTCEEMYTDMLLLDWESYAFDYVEDFSNVGYTNGGDVEDTTTYDYFTDVGMTAVNNEITFWGEISNEHLINTDSDTGEQDIYCNGSDCKSDIMLYFTTTTLHTTGNGVRMVCIYFKAVDAAFDVTFSDGSTQSHDIWGTFGDDKELAILALSEYDVTIESIYITPYHRATKLEEIVLDDTIVTFHSFTTSDPTGYPTESMSPSSYPSLQPSTTGLPICE